MLPNHHITKPVYIGEIRGDGQFDVVWKTKGLVPGDAWSDYLPGSKDLIVRLGQAQVRQLQHRDQEVRRQRRDAELTRDPHADRRSRRRRRRHPPPPNSETDAGD